jgi:hypothetical protein
MLLVSARLSWSSLYQVCPPSLVGAHSFLLWRIYYGVPAARVTGVILPKHAHPYSLLEPVDLSAIFLPQCRVDSTHLLSFQSSP